MIMSADTSTTPTINDTPDKNVVDDNNADDSAAVRYMKSILGERVRCTLEDDAVVDDNDGDDGPHSNGRGRGGRGRRWVVVVGQFICMDRLMNLILTNAIEEREINIDDYKLNNNNNNIDKDEDSDVGTNSNNGKDKDNGNMMTVYRRLAQAMIPGSKIVKLEIDQKIHDDRTKTAAVAVSS
mmetsp:Transcript_29216/g.70425  ORF Transcript_29216/g.70425 Transcript_29216/m.70425 type:complete len:182 (+) Transcript_29216:133-678(+)